MNMCQIVVNCGESGRARLTMNVNITTPRFSVITIEMEVMEVIN